MKSGGAVFRVVVPRPSNEREQREPRMESVEITGFGTSRIQLKNNFSDLFKLQVPVSYLGTMFFASPQEAFDGFIREQREKMEDLHKELDRTAQFILWAEEQTRNK